MTQAAGPPSAAGLRMAVVGPTHPGAGPLAAHTLRLAHQLAGAGHDVTLVSWSPDTTGDAPTGGAATAATSPTSAPAFPRTVRSLAWNRPDTWLRTGRRLQAYDTVVIVHTGAAMVPQHLALLRAAGGGPRGVLVCDAVLAHRAGATARGLVATVLRSVDGVLVHRHEEAALAAQLGAPRVFAVPEPDDVLMELGGRADAADHPHDALDALLVDAEDADLSAPWAAYLGAIEALSAPEVMAMPAFDDPDDPDNPDKGAEDDDVARGAGVLWRTETRSGRWGALARVQRGVRHASHRAVTGAARVAAAGRLLRDGSAGRGVEITRADLPDWLLATDVLDDGWQAEEARDEARRLGLPRSRDTVAAWAALGALAAVVRVADDGGHAAVLVDESGSSSPFGRWARACGFAPVDLGLTTQEAGYDVLEVDAGSLDVVARLHPGGCDVSDLDEAVSQAAWALRPGGLLILTLPLGRPGPDGAMGPADVRAAVARAHDHGFVLVGDLDGGVGRRMRSASRAAGETPARVEGAAYGLVRLTLRRR